MRDRLAVARDPQRVVPRLGESGAFRMAAQPVAGARGDLRGFRRDRHAAGIGERREEEALPLRGPAVAPLPREPDGFVTGARFDGILRRDLLVGDAQVDREVGVGMVGDLVVTEHGSCSLVAGARPFNRFGSCRTARRSGAVGVI